MAGLAKHKGIGKSGQDAGGGTTDYELLNNKPSINKVELFGNKTTIDLGIMVSVDYVGSSTEELPIPTIQEGQKTALIIDNNGIGNFYECSNIGAGGSGSWEIFPYLNNIKNKGQMIYCSNTKQMYICYEFSYVPFPSPGYYNYYYQLASTDTKPNLYDIKTLAQAIADKGWACLSKDTPSVFGTDSTVYKDIKRKYDNVGKVASSWANRENVIFPQFFYDGNYYYVQYVSHTEFNLYKSASMDLSSPTLVANLYSLTNVQIKDWHYEISLGLVGNNKFYVLYQNTNATSTLSLWVFNLSDLSSVFVDTQMPIANYDKLQGKVKVIDYKLYFGYETTIYEVDLTDGSLNTITTTTTANDYTYADFCVFNNYLYCVKYRGDGNGTLVYKIDTSDGTTTLIKTLNDRIASLTIYNNALTLVGADNSSTYVCIYDDTSNTWTDNTISGLGGGCCFQVKQLGDTYYVLFNYGFYKTTNFSSFTVLNAVSTDSGGQIPYDRIILSSENMVYIYTYSSYNSATYYYAGMVKQSYTDTYRIGSSTISQTYYLGEGNTKIVTDNTNSATIYSYLGYFPYFYLNIGTGGVTLPRNSNLWTYMYVSDDYEDSNLPSGNTTRLSPQAEVITDTTSTSKSFSSSNKLKANADYQFGTLTALSFGANSVDDSQLGTTIKFSSGADATTITDTAGITWADGEAPAPSASKTCLILIWNKIGFFKEW